MFLLHPLHLLALEARRPAFPVPETDKKRAPPAAASLVSLAAAILLPRKAKASPQAAP